jgi:hypothetical protein
MSGVGDAATVVTDDQVGLGGGGEMPPATALPRGRAASV